MVLPSSGQIAMSQINTELGRTSTAQISLDTAENGGYATINSLSPSKPSSANPASMSEWWGYNHTYTTTTTTAACSCDSNTCSAGCDNASCFCYEVSDCISPSFCF